MEKQRMGAERADLFVFRFFYLILLLLLLYFFAV